jgi:hypothetical protein
MNTATKLLEAMRRHPLDWRIEQLQTVARQYGIDWRQDGSSCLFAPMAKPCRCLLTAQSSQSM